MSQINLIPNKTYKEEEIVNIIKTHNPSISDTHAKWVLFDMQKSGQITRVGHRKYFSGNAKIYDHSFESDIAKRINKALNDSFPLLRIVIWETIQLNEWVSFLLSKNTIFVEVESSFESVIFDELMNDFGNKYTLLLNPDNEMIARYMRDELIIVRTLFSRSPTNIKKRTIVLEKLVVDIVADKYIYGLLGTEGAEYVIHEIKRCYTVNESKMFTYAKRRNKDKELRDIWGEIND
ncbi:MAG: hypothetical protein IJQ67_04000 [Bacilli bacterium]|nr:hypothetical protein [Bacilli bacterium]